jgi:hypothetical protein
VSSDTLVGCTCPTARRWRHRSSVNRLQQLPVQYRGMKTCGFFPRSYVCSARCGNSAGCRIAWVRLQHHGTVETCNSVKVCGSKFIPNASKLCQHQHSAVPNKYTRSVKCQQSHLSWGAASSVQHHGSLCSKPQQSLLWCLSRPANTQQS